MEIQELGENIMSQGSLPLGAAVNISAMTPFQTVVVAMLMCFLQWMLQASSAGGSQSNSQDLSLESSLLSQRFHVSSCCRNDADP